MAQKLLCNTNSRSQLVSKARAAADTTDPNKGSEFTRGLRVPHQLGLGSRSGLLALVCSTASDIESNQAQEIYSVQINHKKSINFKVRGDLVESLSSTLTYRHL